MDRSESTEELFEVLGLQRQRIKSIEHSIKESNKSLETYVLEQAKFKREMTEPILENDYKLNGQTGECISRMLGLLDW